MKKIIAILILSVTLSFGATFKFKDGTVVNAQIFEDSNSIGKPSTSGLILKVNNKFYLHHYPLKTIKKEIVIDHGNGTYTIKEVKETIPTPAPPSVSEMNPYQLPNCVPARINFIHFSPETLNDLYKYYSAKTYYFKKYNNSFEFTRNKNIALAIYRAAYTRNYATNSVQLTSKWKSRVTKEYGKNPFAITWLGN